MRNLPIKIITIILLVFLFACTATLPEYMLPSISKNTSIDISEVIRYRLLTVENFKSENPEELKKKYNHFAALSTLHMYYDKNKLDQNIRIEQTQSGHYIFTVSNPGYHALFNQRYSWWNKSNDSFHKNYTLQHEQIHFSLWELEARRMNDKRKQDPISVTGATLEEASAKLADKIRSDFETAAELALKQDRKFDIQVSGRYLPKTQSKWMKEIWEDFNSLLKNENNL